MAETWFDTRTGDLLIGAAAAESRLEEAGPDIVPLADLLKNEGFPYLPGEFGASVRGHYEPDEALALGRWALTILTDDTGESLPLTREHIRRLAVLALLPSANFYKQPYKNFTAYRYALDAPYIRVAPHEFADWLDGDWHAYAQKVEAAAHGMPTRRDYLAYGRQHSGPTSWNIQQAGGVTYLNELLGYWNRNKQDKTHYVDYGTAVVMVNGLESLTTPAINILSRRHRGPSFENIRQHVGWAEFRKQSLLGARAQTIESQAARSQKYQAYTKLADSGRLPLHYADLNEATLIQQSAYFLLADACLPDELFEVKEKIVSESAADPAKLVKLLIRQVRSLTHDHIESLAARLNIFEEIWQTDDKQYLSVSEDELAAERERTRTARQFHRTNQRRATIV